MEQNGQYSIERTAVPGASGGLLVRFMRSDRVKAKSKWTEEERQRHFDTGLPIRENIDCIVITLDGGLNETPPIPVRRKADGNGYFDPDTGFLTDDIERFPRQWAAYQSGLSEEEAVIGFPLKHYFKTNPAKVEHYKYFKIFTLEQLADMPQALQQRIGLGAVDDHREANAFLAKARSAAPGIERAEALHNAMEKIDALEALIREMQENGIQPKKKAGRPKKEVVETEDEAA